MSEPRKVGAMRKEMEIKREKLAQLKKNKELRQAAAAKAENIVIEVQ